MNDPKDHKIKISFIEPKFFFNTDRNGNQVTVCKLRGVVRYGAGKTIDLQYAANAPLIPTDVKGSCNKYNHQWLFEYCPERFIIEVVGTATCSSNDTYDKQLGIEIARAKAEQKAYDTALIIVWRDFLAKYDDVMELQEAVNDFHGRAIKAIRHNRNYLFEKTEVHYPNDWLDYEDASKQVVGQHLYPWENPVKEDWDKWKDLDDIDVELIDPTGGTAPANAEDIEE